MSENFSDSWDAELDAGQDPQAAMDEESSLVSSTCSPEWGEMLRYKTDDRDISDLELCIMQGGNGDWYVSVSREGETPIRGVRICTSGGASKDAPGLGQGIAKAYRALFDKANASEHQPEKT